MVDLSRHQKEASDKSPKSDILIVLDWDLACSNFHAEF